MSKTMIEIILDSVGYVCRHTGKPNESIPGGCHDCLELSETIAEELTLAGYGKLPNGRLEEIRNG